MRTIRTGIMAVAIFAMLAGFGGAVVAQAAEDESVEPPTGFEGRHGCPFHSWRGISEHVVVGPLEDGNLVRREIRRGYSVTAIDEMSDPRLDGQFRATVAIDEYVYPGADLHAPPTLVAATVRIENQAGAWQGSGVDASMPDGPMTEWGLMVLHGEGAYDGLTAVWWSNLDDEECSCLDPGNPCRYQVRGAVFDGEVPALPEPPAE